MKHLAKRYLCLISLLIVAVILPVDVHAGLEPVGVDMRGNVIVGFNPSVSADGRYVAFHSAGLDLVPNKTNYPLDDVYVTDRQTGVTERVSVSSEGIEVNHHSRWPAISSDGRFVVFYSWNLVSGQPGWIYLHDRVNKTTELVDVTYDGLQPIHNYGVISAVGPSLSISADGRYVAFESGATNIVPGYTNRNQKIFVRDRLLKTTEIIDGDNTLYSVQPHISADGRFVVFLQQTSTLGWQAALDVCIYDRATGTTEKLLGTPGVTDTHYLPSIPTISADGRFVAFAAKSSNLVAGDTNNQFDVFVHDRIARAFERVSVSSEGLQVNNGSYLGSISADGRFVAFLSKDTDPFMTGFYNFSLLVHDRQTGKTESVTAGGCTYPPAISADGKTVVVVYGNGLYAYDRQTLVAAAGPDQIVEQTSPTGANVTLDGAGSTANCSEPLSYAWTWPGGSATGVSPTVVLPAGVTTVAMDVSACGSSAADTVKITVQDTIKPVSKAVMTGTRGNGDWFLSDVTVILAGTDTGSGVKEIRYAMDGGNETVVAGSAAQITLANEGSHMIVYHAVDNAGNDEATQQLTIKIDKTAPSITGAALAQPNSNGWYNSDVTVHFTALDTISRIASVTPDTVLTVERANQSVTGTAVDAAGNSSSCTVTGINIDRTPPAITITGVTNGATYSLGLVPTAAYVVNDPLSGVSASSGSPPIGGDGLGLGAFSYTVTASDKAGNSANVSVAYTVIATPDGVAALINQMVTSGLIVNNSGTVNSLITKLTNSQLQAFINEVQAQAGKKISQSAADVLINAANYMLSHP